MTETALLPHRRMRYDPVAQGLHWLVAALAVAVVGLGLTIPEAARGNTARFLILLLHRSLGITIFAVMVVRLLWRCRHAPPPLPEHMAPIERHLATAAHWMLYVLFLGMPLTGYLNSAAAGHSVDFFGVLTIPPLLPENPRLAQIAIALHLAGQWLVYLFVAMHSAAALIHHFVRRDDVMVRMLPRRAKARAR
jgi:cytochrome b561